MPVFIAFYMFFADAPSDEPLGEIDCCGFNVFNVYSVAVQIEIYIYISTDQIYFHQSCQNENVVKRVVNCRFNLIMLWVSVGNYV